MEVPEIYHLSQWNAVNRLKRYEWKEIVFNSFYDVFVYWQRREVAHKRSSWVMSLSCVCMYVCDVLINASDKKNKYYCYKWCTKGKIELGSVCVSLFKYVKQTLNFLGENTKLALSTFGLLCFWRNSSFMKIDTFFFIPFTC